MATAEPAAPKEEAGLLVIVVLKAQHLHDRHHYSKQSPFVELEVTNSDKERTAVDPDGGQHSFWDEEFRMPVFRIGDEPQYLYLRVMREEGHDDSELIGEAKVLLDGSWTEFDEWVPIKEDGKYRGEVYLELTWYPRQDMQDPMTLQRHPSKLAPETRSGAGPAAATPRPASGGSAPVSIEYIPRESPGALDFPNFSSSLPPSLPDKSDPGALPVGALPFPGQQPITDAGGLGPSGYNDGTLSLTPRTSLSSAGSSGPPVPPRPASASPSLVHSLSASPAGTPFLTPDYPAPRQASPARRYSPGPVLPERPSSASRPLPAAPNGQSRPSLSPSERKRQEALGDARDSGPFAALPAYSSPVRPAPSPSGLPPIPGAFPASADISSSHRQQETAVSAAETAREEERKRAEAEAKARASRRQEEERQRELERQRQDAERAERLRRMERERIEAIDAAQRAREARRRQEQEDARIAAELAAEAEDAERRRAAAKQAEADALVQKLLAQEQAELAREQKEREQADEEFIRSLREEDERREAAERRAREDADAAFARRMREEDEAERARRVEEDERIARSLAEEDARIRPDRESRLAR
ncbi:hypothetical protein BMF94_0258 [Rhodotorula taiwanensis]|uniref:C2 domain-containing protein n=1 Tax=Rhodotorula taiwanensis TaxID=741276 RepID=A0A2S5BIQ9_9BASI|nr:hypothetical protein BMF94_0258 [Rhodotorula taiwanensis]